MDGAKLPAEAFEPIHLGNLVARLAGTEAEIAAAQTLRYRVFYEEMSAIPSEEVKASRRDFDRFDEICDHLLVIDTKRDDLPGGVVGTYRLLRSTVAEQNGGFYTSDEYEIGRLVSGDGPTLELGRSCVEEEYRNRPTMQLLNTGVEVQSSLALFGRVFEYLDLPIDIAEPVQPKDRMV